MTLEIRTTGSEPTVVAVYEDWVVLTRCLLDEPAVATMADVTDQHLWRLDEVLRERGQRVYEVRY